jgi:hypothetical protein
MGSSAGGAITARLDAATSGDDYSAGNFSASNSPE